jgi:hypothetical protein
MKIVQRRRLTSEGRVDDRGEQGDPDGPDQQAPRPLHLLEQLGVLRTVLGSKLIVILGVLPLEVLLPSPELAERPLTVRH